jgi:hypothetical protein
MRQAQNRIEFFGRNRWIMDMKMTSALAPALSPAVTIQMAFGGAAG